MAPNPSLSPALLGIILAACSGPPPQGPPERRPPVESSASACGEAKRIRLLYSSNLRGALGPVGCPDGLLGGLARRATFLGRVTADLPTILLDAGDLLAGPSDGDRRGPARSRQVQRSELILSVTATEAAASLLCPGEADLRLGTDRLAALLSRHGVLGVLANLVGPDQRPVFPSHRMVTLGGLKVGVVGAMTVGSDDDRRMAQRNLRLTDLVAALGAAVEAVGRAGADLIVALLHLRDGVKEAERLVARVPGIDFAVVGHDGAQLQVAYRVGRTVILEASHSGSHIGQVTVTAFRASRDFVEVGVNSFRGRVELARRRELARLREEAGFSSALVRDHIQQRVAELERLLAAEEDRGARATPGCPGSFEHEVIPLDHRIADDPRIRERVEAEASPAGPVNAAAPGYSGEPGP